MPATRVRPPRLRRLGPGTLIALWLALQSIVYGLWFAITGGAQGDVWYYWRQLETLRYFGPEGTLVEYPTPVIPLLQLPAMLAFGNGTYYSYAFIGFMLALHALLAFALWRWSPIVDGRRDSRPVLYWIVFAFLVGTIVAMRFDIVPAVLAGGAILATARRRPAVAGVLIAVGACIKLWPALLILALLGRRENRLRALSAFLLTGLVVAGLSWWWAGWDRLISPLGWQRDRGLQIESVWATVPMLQRAFGTPHLTVALSPYQAFELFGASRGWLAVASGATVAGGIAILVVSALWLFSPARRDLGVAAMLMVFITGVMIVTNKTFSPQYVIWLSGPLAALLTLGRGQTRLRPTGATGFILTAALAIAALTQLIYPLGYDGLVLLDWRTIPMSVVLALRNVAMVILVVVSAWIVLRARRTATAAPAPNHEEL